MQEYSLQSDGLFKKILILSHFTDINEVTFVPDANVTTQIVDGNHIGPTEYVAITICSMLIGLIYVASVFFYLHLKKKRQNFQDGKGK